MSDTGSSSSILSTETEGGVTVLRMDDGKANALSHDMVAALDSALDAAPADSGALVLAGRPGRFCAGFDMSVMMAGANERRELVERGAEFLLKLYMHPRPVIAAATGHSLAGGAILLLTADVRIGVQGPFRIGLNEVAIGMPLPTFGVEMARSRIAVNHLQQAAGMAKIYDPDAAAKVGFLDAAVSEDKLIPSVMEVAGQLAELPNPAYGATKRRLRKATVEAIRENFAEEMAKLAG